MRDAIYTLTTHCQTALKSLRAFWYGLQDMVEATVRIMAEGQVQRRMKPIPIRIERDGERRIRR